MQRSICLQETLKSHLLSSSHKQQKENGIDSFQESITQKYVYTKIRECSHVSLQNYETKKLFLKIVFLGTSSVIQLETSA